MLEFHEFGEARERRAAEIRPREIARRGNEGRNVFAPKFEMMIIRSKKKCFPGENSLLDDLHTGGALLFFSLMKHIITITSLLAAGTVLANAEVLIDVAEISQSGNNWTASWSVGDATTLSNYWAVQVTLDEFAATKTGYTLVQLNSAVWFKGQSDSPATSTYLGLQFAGKDHWVSANGEATGSSLLYTDVVANKTPVTVVNNNGTFSFWVGNEQKTLRNGDNATDGGSTVSISESAAATIASGFGVVSTLASLKVASFTAEDLNSVNIADIVSSMSSYSIPEPSAFGLLAGLGALALAGTRRRRRKA